jgi:hypothetical protein
MEATPGGKRAELRQGYVLSVMSLQVLPDLADDEVLPADLQTLSPLFDVGSSEMLDNRQKERLAINRRRATRDGPVQSEEPREQFAIRNDSTAEVRQIVPVSDLQGKSPEDIRIQAESSIEIPVRVCRFAGVRLAAVNKEDLSRECSVYRT